MNFNTLDKMMRQFEKSLDRRMNPDHYLAARLDGHGFTKLTKLEWNLDRPFDIRFHEAMKATLLHLMDCGFNFIYGYTQSDEISLLFNIKDDSFGHKERKLISLLAAEASVAFSLNSGHKGVFDCRLSPLPDADAAIDYFRWRREDCNRNSLNSYCYWLNREKGASPADAHAALKGISNTEKLKMLKAHGIDFNALPSWQLNGCGCYFKSFYRDAMNPLTGRASLCRRRELILDADLPSPSEYSEMLRHIIDEKLPSETPDYDELHIK